MLFKNNSVIFCIVFNFLSWNAFAVEDKQKLIVDGKGLINQASELSKEIDLSSLVEKSKDVNLEEYNVDSLKGSIQKEYGQVSIVDDTIDSFSEILADPNNTRTMNPLQAISGYANENEARNREEMLNFLGLSEKKNHLYVFVSYSMPDDMIAAYSREAIWAGASLVVKGLKEGKDIGDFIQGKAKDLLAGKGYTAALHFDPRLFDAFSIDYVPAIVLADENFIDYCEDSEEAVIDINGTKRCMERPADKFVKVSGAITLDYALEQFIEEGSFAEGAYERLESLRKNIGKTDYTDQVEVYDFDDDLLPHQKKKLYDEYSKFGEVIETEYGISVIPFETPQRMGVHLKRHKTTRK